MTMDNFTIGANRTRPPYLPKTIRCLNCNAPISMYSEKSQLVVCDSCGQQLDCSKEELIALGKPEKQGNFGLEIHQVFTWDDVKYKVIARMRFQDRWGDFTDEFLIFHPFHGTKWISIYKGEDGQEFSISEDKHALALENPFQTGNSTIRTGDSFVWNKESESEMLLEYVDGALPWLAKAGDRTQAIEYYRAGNRNYFMTAEQTNLGSTEIEYSFSRKISGSEFLKGLGQGGKSAPAGGGSSNYSSNEYVNSPEVDTDVVKMIIMLIVIAMIIFFFLGCVGSCIGCSGGGGGGYSGRTHYGGGLGGGK